MTIDTDRLRGIVAFVQAAELLKDTLRSAHTRGGRQESTAEHSWRLCLMAMLLSRDLAPADPLRLLKLCVIHDLGEALSGDVPAPEQHVDDGRTARERADFDALCAPLPEDLRAEMRALRDEYDRAESAEAVAVRGLDKIETVLQHAVGANPPGFDYGFNLDYGRGRTDAHPLLQALRALADDGTRARKG